ncbi:MAG: LLM class F420-dependent oxidoreductase [Myxococcales bacterium]|nr:LLM class F420-dependent oxidoreductase [Myxococcales bacterium]
MKVDGGLLIGGLAEASARARALEADGYDGIVSAEVSNDPFLPLALAAEQTERVELMTSIAVAFARNPMILANTSHDLNLVSKGRFILGIGSQIRPHITKRFSMPWSQPAARMREFILAMRAIWDCWYRGEPLAFRGDFYTHTLMTPNFTPQDATYGEPRVFLAAVGPRMTEVAGEVADGMIAHGFTTERYLREVSLPALEKGLARSARSRSDFEISCPVFVVTGADEESFTKSREMVGRQISFYGSTPAYRPVLELCGRGELQTELNHLSKQGRWDDMATLIDDDLVEEFAVVGRPEEVPELIRKRFGDLIDRMMCTFQLGDPELQKAMLAALRDTA